MSPSECIASMLVSYATKMHLVANLQILPQSQNSVVHSSTESTVLTRVSFLHNVYFQLGHWSFHVADPVIWNPLRHLHSTSVNHGEFQDGLKTHQLTQLYT